MLLSAADTRAVSGAAAGSSLGWSFTGALLVHEANARPKAMIANKTDFANTFFIVAIVYYLLNYKMMMVLPSLMIVVEDGSL
jgi:hypothetical protein